MPKYNNNGLAVYYEIHGQGEPLILLHHGAGSTIMWEDVLSGFAAKYRVITYDRRGFGQSDGGENFQDYYKSEDYAENCVTELSAFLEYLGITENIRFLGQCEGGAIAYRYTSYNPDKVTAVALSTTMCCSKSGQSQPQDQPPTEPQGNREPPNFDTAPPEMQEKFIHWQGEEYAPEMYRLFFEGGGVYDNGPDKPFDLRPVCQNIQRPALVLYPDRSRLFNVEQAVMIYQSLPQGELAVIPGCGHNNYSERPEEYQRIVLDFFERHS
ncbi:MAG: alpha/beta hydrolase [Dehalococcoidales bacterium]|nr:alpha/beta hydrolase [Dehalococcoidales bacterium]